MNFLVKLNSLVNLILFYIRIRFKPHREKRAIQEINSKFNNGEKITVAFIVFDNAIWKYHSLYVLLDDDPKYLPYVIIAKKKGISGYERDELYSKSFEFFSSRYRLINQSDSSYSLQRRYLKLISPDIIVNSIPYSYLDRPFLIESNLKRITIYGQYGVNLTNWKFVVVNSHNYLLSRMYVESKINLDIYSKWRELKVNNMAVSGPLKADQFNYGDKDNYYQWKQPHNKRLIWAPHWTLEVAHGKPEFLGNFLEYHQLFQDMAVRYANEVTFCLKPHPLLKSQLYLHEQWGPNRTDEYFSFWENGDNTMLEEGEYVELFNSSDAMIHDSGSFIVEYLYTGKTVAFIINQSSKGVFNEYGDLALDSIEIVSSERDIENFITDLINNVDKHKSKREIFYNEYLRDNHHRAAQNIKTDIEKFLGI